MAQGGAAARSPPVPYGDEHKALELQRAFEAASADAPASPGWPAGPTGMVAALAQAALEGGGSDEDAESEDSALYDPPPGPPHVPAALLNQAEPPVAQWEEMAAARESGVRLQFGAHLTEHVRMISPRDAQEHDDGYDDSFASFDDGLGVSDEERIVAVIQ